MKYGDMSKVYIKIFNRRNFLWQQKFNLKKDGEKIVKALKENGFDPDLETKIITHGYIDNGIIFLNSFAEAYENRGKNNKNFAPVSGSCHLERVSNVKIGVECQIFVIVIFLTVAEF